MATKSLEARLDELEATARNTEAALEIIKLQARYTYYMDLNYTDRIVDELFAQKDPQVKCEICDTGIYEGIESVRRLFRALHDQQAIRGYLGIIMLETPFVQVSKDGKTARGMWHGFGPNSANATYFPADKNHQDTLTALWFMGKYDNEYVKEGGKWKIRSLRLVCYFQAPYEEGWLKVPDARRWAPNPEICKPDRPSTVFKPYHPHAVNKLLPEPPENIE